MNFELFLICLISTITSNIASIKIGILNNNNSIKTWAHQPIIVPNGVRKHIDSLDNTLLNNIKTPFNHKIFEIGDIPEHLQEGKSLLDILKLIKIYEDSIEDDDDDSFEYETQEL